METIFNFENIPIIDVVSLKNRRIDAIVLHYYNDIDFLPHVLKFNNIPNIESITNDMVINLPDRFVYENMLINIDEDIDVFCGCINVENNLNTNKLILRYNKDKTIGTKKLNLILDKITYDKETGIVKF